MLPVEKNVPIPPITRHNDPEHGREKKYPMASMEVGDMFVIRPKSVTDRSITAYVSRRGAELGREFTTRRIHVKNHAKPPLPGDWRLCDPDDPKATTTVGVWRTK